MKDKVLGSVKQKGGAAGIAEALHVNLSTGLTSEGNSEWGFEARKEVFGSNMMKEIDPKGFFSLFVEQLEDPIIILLILAALVRFEIGMSIAENGILGEYHTWSID